VYVELTATDGDTTKTLAAGFAGATTYSGCFTTVNFDSAGSARIELTIHGDHLFYSDLGDTPSVRFSALANADTDDDGAITPAELAAAPAGAGAGADNLLALLEALVATLVHIDGEGHCADTAAQ